MYRRADGSGGESEMTDWNRGAQPTCDDPTANLAPGGAGWCLNDRICEREGCQKAKIQLARMEQERRKHEKCEAK